MPEKKKTTTRKRTVAKMHEAPQEPFGELGVGGGGIFGGRIYDEFQRELQGDKAARVYREMRDNCPVIGGMMFAVEQFLRSVAIDVRAADTDPTAERAADLVLSSLDDMDATWADTLTEMLSCLQYGWSFHEVVYKRRGGDTHDPTARSKYADGLIGLRKIAIRPQDTRDSWVFDDAGNVSAMIQRSQRSYEAITIPLEKAILLRAPSARGNPEGRSVLRSAWVPYHFWRRHQVVEGIGVERDLTGIPKLFVPNQIAMATSGAELTVKNEIKEIMKNIRNDEQAGVMLPSVFDANTGNRLYDFELMASPGSKSIDVAAVIERLERRMAMTILADFILLGHEGVGSYALNTSKVDAFSIALEGWLDGILESVNRQLIPALMALNGFPMEASPRLVHAPIKQPSLEELAAFMQAAYNIGLDLGDDDTSAHLRRRAQLPVDTDDDMAVGKRASVDVARLEAAIESLREVVGK